MVTLTDLRVITAAILLALGIPDLAKAYAKLQSDVHVCPIDVGVWRLRGLGFRVCRFKGLG